MPEEPENWWEATPDEGKQDDAGAPEPIAIRGYQREGDEWVRKGEEEDDGASEGGSPEWSAYSKQKAAVSGIFLFTFIVGDWWWDGSNGFGALAKTPSAIIDFWPQMHTWTQWHPYPIIQVISWALWDITPAVFLLSFLFGSGISINPNMREDSEEIRRIGKKAHRNLKYFVFALILMDFMSFASWDPFAVNTFLDYPTEFFAMRPGIHWMLMAFAASFGLVPDKEIDGLKRS